MATPLLLGRSSPRCIYCLHKSLRAEWYDPISSFQLQLRGKKKQAKTVQARLARDIATWGRKGAVINVAPGRMRNIWLPRGEAEYVTAAQLKASGELPVDRDPTFGIRQPLGAGGAPREKLVERELDIQVPLLNPRQAAEIIDNTIPPVIHFFRKPILSQASEEASTPRASQDPANSSVRGYVNPEILAAASGDAQKAIEGDRAPKPKPKPSPTAIYGSVTTADITTNIKAVLAAEALDNDDAGRVVLTAEDVFIIQEADAAGETDRVKALGDYEIEIRLLQAPVIRRTVKVEAIGSKFQSEQDRELAD